MLGANLESRSKWAYSLLQIVNNELYFPNNYTMSKRDDEESLYDWYINSNLRKTCPRCSSQNIRDIEYVQDKDGQGTVYRCQKCFYTYGIEDETLRAYFDVNS